MRIPFRRAIEIIQSRGLSTLIRETLNYLSRNPSYFKLQSRINTFKYKNYSQIEPKKPIYIDPSNIQFKTKKELPAFDPQIHIGTIVKGRWDQSPIEVQIPGPNNDDFHTNFPSTKKMKTCFEGISKAQLEKFPIANELDTESLSNHEEYPPTVNISRNGDLQINSGYQQLLFAAECGLNAVPVRVCVRHQKWQRFRNQIKYYIHKYLDGISYNQLPHPDLQLNAVHNPEKRFNLIYDAVEFSDGSVLDIGSHMDGYFCYKLDKMGFDCYAIETAPVRCWFLQKFKTINNSEYTIINEDITETKILDKKFDIILGLNVFHHFLKEKIRYEKLINILNNISAKIMFVQTHTDNYIESYERDGGTWYRKEVEEDFVQIILDNSSFSEYDILGRPEDDNRPIYKLY